MNRYELICDLSGSRDPEAMFKDVYYATSKDKAIQMAYDTWKDEVFTKFNVVSANRKEKENEI